MLIPVSWLRGFAFKLLTCPVGGEGGIIDTLLSGSLCSVILDLFGSCFADGGLVPSPGGRKSETEVLAVPATVALNAGSFLDRDDYFAVSDECLAVER